MRLHGWTWIVVIGWIPSTFCFIFAGLKLYQACNSNLNINPRKVDLNLKSASSLRVSTSTLYTTHSRRANLVRGKGKRTNDKLWAHMSKDTVSNPAKMSCKAIMLEPHRYLWPPQTAPCQL